MDRYPQQQRSAAQPARPVAESHNTASPARQSKKSKKVWWIVAIVIVVVLAALCIAGRFLLMGGSQVDSSRYQAVFLSNGQVYFGKVHDYYTEHPYLTNVYYIQAQNGQASTSTATQTGETNQQLVKLGGEIHGPDDEMILNKQSILFVENLKSDSKVVKLIQNGGK